MSKLHYTITINAPAKKVWETMLNKETYNQWCSPFQEGSTFEGSWEKGSEIRFIAEGENGVGGMYSKIAENRPYEFISIAHQGLIVKGEVDTTSEEAKEWQGSYENYTFTEKDGVTTLEIDLENEALTEEFAKMFDEMWPQALEKLKQLAEQE